MTTIPYKSNNKRQGRKLIRPDVEELVKLYVKDNLTAKEIALIYRVKPQTVRKWISFYRQELNEQ